MGSDHYTSHKPLGSGCQTHLCLRYANRRWIYLLTFSCTASGLILCHTGCQHVFGQKLSSSGRCIRLYKPRFDTVYFVLKKGHSEQIIKVPKHEFTVCRGSGCFFSFAVRLGLFGRKITGKNQTQQDSPRILTSLDTTATIRLNLETEPAW